MKSRIPPGLKGVVTSFEILDAFPLPDGGGRDDALSSGNDLVSDRGTAQAAQDRVTRESGAESSSDRETDKPHRRLL